MRMDDQFQALLGGTILALTVAWPAGGALAADSAFVVRTGQRQLFLDDHGVASIEGLERTMHQPTKRGVVLRPDIPSDGWGMRTYTAPMWDPQEKVYKIVYAAIKEWKDGRRRVGSALAISKDGLTWQKPVLGLVEVDGSKQNNRIVVPPLGVGTDLVNVIYDPDDPDPSRRYKGLQGTSGRVPVVSADCIHWRALDVEPLPSSDVSFLAFDRDEKRYLALLKIGNRYGRAYSIAISEDFQHWTKPRFIFGGDAKDQQIAPRFIRRRLALPGVEHLFTWVDPDPATGWKKPAKYQRTWSSDCYNFAVFPYEGLYMALPMIYYAVGQDWDTGKPVNTDGFDHLRLAMSRDLAEWKYLGDREPFLEPSGAEGGLAGVFDRCKLRPMAPLVKADALWFYYNGWKRRCNHLLKLNPDRSKRDPATLTADQKADLAEGASGVCLAVLRRDGFISLDAGSTEGTILTRPFTLPGGRLFVNVDAPNGELRVEVVDAAGKVVARSRALTGDLMREPVKWAKGDIADLEGLEVSLRFKLRKGKLYSYWQQ